GANGTFIPINSVAFFDDKIWAATNAGLYFANASAPNLNDFSIWNSPDTLITSAFDINTIVAFGNKLIVNRSLSAEDSIYSFDGTTWAFEDKIATNWDNYAFEVTNNGTELVISNRWNVNLYDSDLNHLTVLYEYSDGIGLQALHTSRSSDGVIWFADNQLGLGNSDGNYSTPNGPNHSNAYNMDIVNGTLWSVSGGQNQSNGNGLGRSAGIHTFRDGSWKSITRANNDLLGQNNVVDLLDIAVDPQDNTKIYASTLGWGLIEIIDDEVMRFIDETNSSLVEENPNNTWHFVGVTGMEYDDNGNLWMLNTRATTGLQVKTASDQWHSYAIPPLSNRFYLRDLIIGQNGYKWMTVRDGDQGLVVFDDNGTLEDTSDDRWLHLKAGEGNGNLPSATIYSIKEDLDGSIWVGTFEGVAVFHNALNIFDVDNKDAQRILVEKDGYTQYLFESEVVTSIDVDGSNRKWMGTESSGVFLLSEDGTEEIHHFTIDNSPLLSNSIEKVSINQKTGEVFMASDIGIVSYKGDATGGEPTYSSAYVYPNPVYSAYNGPIVITGLIKDSFLKITDVSGNLVHETQAKGGQATWDGNNFSGNRVKSGVYLVYAYDDNATQRFVSKFLMIK
ncbi:MAG: T9SS type A sorting domain-containing protein, partial [Flavobacteriales bacterium]|nr:T9SS type A sorting domain-containing protein [Flavobacteriales bacterium]